MRPSRGRRQAARRGRDILEAGRAPIMHFLERQHADTMVDAFEVAIAIVERE